MNLLLLSAERCESQGVVDGDVAGCWCVLNGGRYGEYGRSGDGCRDVACNVPTTIIANHHRQPSPSTATTGHSDNRNVLNILIGCQYAEIRIAVTFQKTGGNKIWYRIGVTFKW